MSYLNFSDKLGSSPVVKVGVSLPSSLTVRDYQTGETLYEHEPFRPGDIERIGTILTLTGAEVYIAGETEKTEFGSVIHWELFQPKRIEPEPDPCSCPYPPEAFAKYQARSLCTCSCGMTPEESGCPLHSAPCSGTIKAVQRTSAVYQALADFRAGRI